MRRVWLPLLLLLTACALAAPDDAYLVDGTALVPLRPIAEWLGVQITYEAITGRITLTQGDRAAVLTLGQKTATVGEQPIALQQPVITYDGATRVPLRFFAEGLGAGITWDGATNEATVAHPATGAKRTLTAQPAPQGIREAILAANRAQAPVFTTDTGTRYHNEQCAALGTSKHRLTLGEAAAKGYIPCTRCKAPDLPAGIAPATDLPPLPPPAPTTEAGAVYVTKSGKKYHVDGCPALTSSKIALTLAEAKAKGYTPCSRCKPGA